MPAPPSLRALGGSALGCASPPPSSHRTPRPARSPTAATLCPRPASSPSVPPARSPRRADRVATNTSLPRCVDEFDNAPRVMANAMTMTRIYLFGFPPGRRRGRRNRATWRSRFEVVRERSRNRARGRDKEGRGQDGAGDGREIPRDRNSRIVLAIYSRPARCFDKGRSWLRSTDDDE